MSILNQYSFVFFILLLLGILAIVLFRKGVQKRKIAIYASVVVGLIAIWFMIKPSQNLSISQDQTQTLIGSGLPVLLEFQSPY